MRSRRLLEGHAVASMTALAISAVGAAAQAAPATPTASAAQVDEVIVTARRSEERLQDVPAAVTAVTSRQLEAMKPRTLQDLSGVAPNVQIGVVGAGAGAAAIYIRGLGYQDIEKGQNPAVGLLIDDVVIGTNTAQLIDSFDLAQVEIDRGPQGIFYGKNTTAGAISVHRTRPTRAWGLNASLAFGDYAQQIERILLNAPLGATAGLKLGVSHRARDGFLDNIYTGDTHYGRDELTTGTVAVETDLGPKATALLTADFTHQDGEGTPLQLGNPAAAKLLAGAGLAFNSVGSPYIPGVTVPLGVRQVANDYPDRNLLSQQRYSLNLHWDSAVGQWDSITAFINQTDDAEQDFDGSCGISALGGRPCPVLPNPLLATPPAFPFGGFLHTSRPQIYRQFTQETRLSREIGPVKLMAGVYYFRHEISALELSRTTIPGIPADSPALRQISGETNHSFSGFFNADYQATDQLRLSAGVRYIQESTRFHNAFHLAYLPGVGPADIPTAAFQASKSWSRAITRLSADYKLTEDTLLYASRSEGFRSGGFSPRGTLSESAPGQTNYSPGANYLAFAPETDVAYELGAKNTLLDGQLTLNLAAFWTDVKGHQESEVVLTPGYLPGTNTYIVNLPKVRIKGLELETAFRPRAVPGLTLSADAGYQDAKIVDGRVPGVEAPVNPDATAGAPGTVYDETGTPLERVPKFQYGLRVDYETPLGPGKANINLGYRWQDKIVFLTVAGIPDVQPAYGLMDGSISYEWGRYRLTLSGKNLLDKDYRTNSIPAVFIQGWAEPRTLLVELQARW